MDNERLVNCVEPLSVQRRNNCYLTVEPVILIILFCTALTGSVTINLLETRVCLTELNLGEGNCTQPLSDEVELLVQPKTAQLNMFVSIIQAVVPCILSLFIGPWSDQNGRRPFLILSLAGFTCSYLVWGILASVTMIDAKYFLLAPILNALSGGMVAINTCCNCYISDISTEKDRAFRLTLMQSTSLFGTVSGYLISIKLLSYFINHGYEVVFFIAAFCCLICLLYVLFLVRESVILDDSRETRIFLPHHVKSILSVVFVKRVGYNRGVTILITIACFFMNYLIAGEGSVKFLALKKAYAWSLDDFNYFSAVSDTVCVVTSVVGILILRKLLKIPDIWISVTAASIWCTSDILNALSKSGQMFWTFSLMGTTAALFGPTITSELSKSVQQQDLGKLFAFEATLESLCPFAAPPLYTMLYTAVYLKTPLAIYFLSAGFAAVLVVLALFTYCLKRWCNSDSVL